MVDSLDDAEAEGVGDSVKNGVATTFVHLKVPQRLHDGQSAVQGKQQQQYLSSQLTTHVEAMHAVHLDMVGRASYLGFKAFRALKLGPHSGGGRGSCPHRILRGG